MNRKLIGLAAGAMLLAGCLLGCTIPLSNGGEVGFKQSTTWSFYHTTVDTKAKSEAAVEFPAVEDLIKSKAEDKPEPVVDGGGG